MPPPENADVDLVAGGGDQTRRALFGAPVACHRIVRRRVHGRVQCLADPVSEAAEVGAACGKSSVRRRRVPRVESLPPDGSFAG